MKYIKYLPNSLTVLRIVLSVSLLMLKPLSVSFFIIYIVCGLTDIFDGYIARKTNNISKFGATIDSIADIVFVSIVLVILIPRLPLVGWMIIWLMGVTLIRMLSLAVGYVKYHTFASLHTYLNKATGLILFFLPFIYQLAGIKRTALTILFLASLSATEELLLTMKSKILNVNNKGLFFK